VIAIIHTIITKKGLLMHTITKKELVDRIADQTSQKRVVVKKVVQLFLDEVIEELGRGNRLEFRDFGVFETKKRAARIAQNPKTLQRVHVPPKRTVKFKVGRMMKQKLQDGLDGQNQAAPASVESAQVEPSQGIVPENRVEQTNAAAY
jgi:integration host factor subunit beta